LRDSSTTCIEKDEQELDINHGLFLDIYPLYEHPEHFFDAHINIIMSFVYRILVAGRVPYNHGTAVKAISRVVLWFYQGECRNRKIKQIKKRLNRRGKSSSYVTYYGLDVTPLHTIQYDKAWFQKPVRMEFEGAAFWGPTDPDAYLTRRYGNYMELPPEEERIPHHSYVIADTKKSYTEYRDAKRNEI
jgi:lipopolysaccharide cholinephosphotransferase